MLPLLEFTLGELWARRGAGATRISLTDLEILGGIEGTTYYGSNAVSGVILIRTKNGS